MLLHNFRNCPRTLLALINSLPEEKIKEVINAKDPSGFTVLHYAFQDGIEFLRTHDFPFRLNNFLELDLVNCLVKKGADVTIQSFSDYLCKLDRYIVNFHPDVCKQLSNIREDLINAVSKYGTDVKTMLLHGLNPELIMDHDGFSENVKEMLKKKPSDILREDFQINFQKTSCFFHNRIRTLCQIIHRNEKKIKYRFPKPLIKEIAIEIMKLETDESSRSLELK